MFYQPSLLSCCKNWSSSAFLEPSFNALPLPRENVDAFGLAVKRTGASSITAVKGTDDELIAVALLPMPKLFKYCEPFIQTALVQNTTY